MPRIVGDRSLLSLQGRAVGDHHGVGYRRLRDRVENGALDGTGSLRGGGQRDGCGEWRIL